VTAFAERRVQLREIVEVTHGRGYTLLLVLLALPFCTPIPMPGLSLPFGLVIALIGFRLSLRQKPWLPQRLLDVYLPPRFFPKFLSATRRLVRGMEYLSRPRWTFLLDSNLLHHGHGAIILLCGLFLVLPLPLPFSNGLPAMTVVLLAAAMLGRDGLFVVAGLLIFVVTLGFYGFILFGGVTAADWLQQWFAGTFAAQNETVP
jgi:hypothetical protein